MLATSALSQPPTIHAVHRSNYWSSGKFYKLQLHPFRHDLYCHFCPTAPQIPILPPLTLARAQKRKSALTKRAFWEKASGGSYFQIEVVRQWTICSKIYFCICFRIFTKLFQKILTYLRDRRSSHSYLLTQSNPSSLLWQIPRHGRQNCRSLPVVRRNLLVPAHGWALNTHAAVLDLVS